MANVSVGVLSYIGQDREVSRNPNKADNKRNSRNKRYTGERLVGRRLSDMERGRHRKINLGTHGQRWIDEARMCC